MSIEQLRAQQAAVQKEVEDYKRNADLQLAFLQGKAAALQQLIDAAVTEQKAKASPAA